MIQVMADAGNIGTRIARRRQVLGMTQADLAARTGVTKTAVVNWESGRHFPKRKLGLIEQVLGISLEDKAADPLLEPQDDHEEFIVTSPRLTRDDKRQMIASYRRARASGAGPFPSPPAAAGDDRGRPESAAS